MFWGSMLVRTNMTWLNTTLLLPYFLPHFIVAVEAFDLCFDWIVVALLWFLLSFVSRNAKLTAALFWDSCILLCWKLTFLLPAMVYANCCVKLYTGFNGVKVAMLLLPSSSCNLIEMGVVLTLSAAALSVQGVLFVVCCQFWALRRKALSTHKNKAHSSISGFYGKQDQLKVIRAHMKPSISIKGQMTLDNDDIKQKSFGGHIIYKQCKTTHDEE